MAKASLSGKEKTIGSISDWYDDQREALRDLRMKIREIIINPDFHTRVNEKFITLSLTDLNNYFDDSEDELEHLVCLDLISATEAFLRVDYHERIREKDKSSIGRAFRNLNKKKGNKISLEEDIIETWKNNTPDNIFSDFLGLLKYRHWLAHGRYWTPKLGREYSFNIAYEISENILNFISSQN